MAATAWRGLGGNPRQALPHLHAVGESGSGPAHLYMSALDQRGQVVLVSFSLGRLMVLTPAELEVARWAHAGHANGVIARERHTVSHTVARQMASLMQKLGIRARLGLATIPELGAWSTPSVETRLSGSAPLYPLSGNGREVDPQNMAHLWREIASGYWSVRAGVDAGGLRHAVMVRDSPRDVDWRLLTRMHREVLALLADGLPLKTIAIKLGLASSTVSTAMGSARRRLGFASLIQVVRAYCAMKDIIDESVG